MAIQRATEATPDKAEAIPSEPRQRLFTVDEYYKMAEVGIGSLGRHPGRWRAGAYDAGSGRSARTAAPSSANVSARLPGAARPRRCIWRCVRTWCWSSARLARCEK